MDVVLRRVSSATFVGRADELASWTARRRARPGMPAFAFVAGESGVGKSRLVAEFEARATDAGARVLIGHCLELGGTVFPYAPLVDALRPSRASWPTAVGPRAPAGTRARSPSCCPSSSEGSAAAHVAGAAVRGPAGAARATSAARARRARARGPALGRSLHARLPRLPRAQRAHRAAVPARHLPLRRAAPPPPAAPGARRARARAGRRSASPSSASAATRSPSSSPASSTRRPTRSWPTACTRAAQGNPLYTEELLAASSDGLGELPETLRDALLGRFERLPAAAQEVVRVAAVVERPMSHALLEAELSSLPADELLAGAREAVAHQLLVTHTDGTYAFRHALVGEAIYEDLLPGERTALHAALAAVLERDPALHAATSPRRPSAPSWPATGSTPTTCRARSAPRSRPAWPRGASTPTARRCATSSARSSCGTASPTPRSAPACPASTCCAPPPRSAGDAFEAGPRGRRSSARRSPAARTTPTASSAPACTPSWRATCGTRTSTTRATTSSRRALELLPARGRARARAAARADAKNLMLRGHMREAVDRGGGRRPRGAPARRRRRVEAGADEHRGLRARRARRPRGGRAGCSARRVDLASREGTPSDHVRAVINLSEMLDLSGRTDEALAVVRADAAGGPRGTPSRSSYDTFLEIQYANELLRARPHRGGGRRAARPHPRRPRSGRRRCSMLDVRARIALAARRRRRGAPRARRAAPPGPRHRATRSGSRRSSSRPRELAVRDGRLEDARAAAARGLAALEGTDEGAAAEAAVGGADGRGRGRRAGRARSASRSTRRPRRRCRRGWRPRAAAPASGPRARCYAALAARRGDAGIEHALGPRRPDPARLARRRRRRSTRSALPWPAAYARLRAAEAHVAAGDRAAAAEPLTAARAAAAAMEAAPLVEAADALARRARIRRRGRPEAGGRRARRRRSRSASRRASTRCCCSWPRAARTARSASSSS